MRRFMLFLKVPRKEGERVRKQLLEAGIISDEYEILKDEANSLLMFPVLAPFSGYPTVELEGAKRPKEYKKLSDALAEFLSPKELEMIISSFDIIGDIAIMEIPDTLEPKERQIGEALLKVHKNLRTVLKKLGPMEGEYRVRKVKVIAGEERAETEYKENGVRMRLDVSKVYFSVRLAHERARIADLVRDGERVLVMFAGVGPFAFAIAKKHPEAQIVAVELNPEAVKYMRESVALNKFANIEAIEGDVRAVPLQSHSFDRVIMPLPKLAHEFLDVAFRAVKNRGIVHFYTITDINRPFAEALEKAEAEAKKAGVSVQAQSQRIVKPYSPAMVQVVLDLAVLKQN